MPNTFRSVHVSELLPGTVHVIWNGWKLLRRWPQWATSERYLNSDMEIVAHSSFKRSVEYSRYPISVSCDIFVTSVHSANYISAYLASCMNNANLHWSYLYLSIFVGKITSHLRASLRTTCSYISLYLSISPTHTWSSYICRLTTLICIYHYLCWYRQPLSFHNALNHLHDYLDSFVHIADLPLATLCRTSAVHTSLLSLALLIFLTSFVITVYPSFAPLRIFVHRSLAPLVTFAKSADPLSHLRIHQHCSPTRFCMAVPR